MQLFLPAALTVALVLTAPHEPPTQPSIRIMSFNIRYGTADDGADSWEHRRDLVFAVIRDERPDIIGVQEALRFQLDELQRALPEYSELGVGRADGDTAGEYAAILYRRDRFRVEDSGTFWFSDTPEVPGSISWGANLPRICTWARLVDESAAHAFYVYNVHFDHESQESRERSARLLLERIEARRHPDPLTVIGDFNAGEDNPAMLILKGEGAAGVAPRLRDTFRIVHPDAVDVGTFNGFRGVTTGPKIDAILVSDGFEVMDAAILNEAREGRYASDHYPITTMVKFSGSGGNRTSN